MARKKVTLESSIFDGCVRYANNKKKEAIKKGDIIDAYYHEELGKRCKILREETKN